MALTLCVSMAAATSAGTFCYAQENTDANMSESFVPEEPGDTKIQSVVHEDTDYVPGEVIIVIKKEYSELNKEYTPEDFPGVEIQEIEYLTPLRESAEGTLINLSKFRQILLLRLTDESKQGVRDAIAVLNENEIVRSAEPNYIWEWDEPEVNRVEENSLLIDETAIWNEALAQNAAVTPNDTMFSQQTNMAAINAPAAWALTTGKKTVKVGVVDSGIAYHPDLAANVVDGWDFIDKKPVKFADVHGHGTHVAGIIGAIGNNGTGVAGVAWNVQLVPLRVTHKSEGRADELIAVIEYANAHDIPI